MRLIAAGQTDQEISKNISLSEETVNMHVSAMMSKLSLKDPTQVAAWINNHIK